MALHPTHVLHSGTHHIHPRQHLLVSTSLAGVAGGAVRGAGAAAAAAVGQRRSRDAAPAHKVALKGWGTEGCLL